MSVFGDDDLGDILTFGVLLVNILTIDKHNDIRVLLDGPALT